MNLPFLYAQVRAAELRIRKLEADNRTLDSLHEQVC